jgi:alpha-ketoglutaric semialdehyde dehydrogenase
MNTTLETKLGHYIGGEFVAAQAAEWTPSVDPADPERILAVVPLAGDRDVDLAVSAAESATRSWRGTAASARGDVLHAWAHVLEDRSAELAEAIAREVGKPIGEARGEVARGVAILRYYATEAVRPVGDVIPALAAASLQYSLHQPLGTVGLITPWNFPIAIPLWKAAPALAVGNTVVLKPSEMSGWSAHLLAETAREAGVPAGVFNVVHGGGAAGAALVRHQSVRGVSFTGSARVGAVIAEACARRNVKFQTEMGGKNVGIVLADADLVRAATLVAGGAMRFAGQKCTATSRVVVERSVRDAFLAELKKAIDALPLGSPMEDRTAIGPVISEASQVRLLDSIDRADAERIQPSGAIASEKGFFVPPTVFAGVDPEASIAQEELFGPVLAVLDADDLDHALELSNRTRFGLSASLFTRDIASALRYVERIEAGMVRVNGDTTGVDPHAPFGGMKGSSSHSREQGPAARDFYTEIKTVQINP